MIWRTTTSLYTHQQAAVDKVLPSRVAALFMEQGTGKTRTAIQLAWLRRQKISRVVWFCPVSLKETVRHEILKHTDCPAGQVHVFDERTSVRRLPEALWYVVGTESMSSSDRVTLAAAALIDERTFVIVDESSYIKGHHSRRTLRITALAEKARYRLILTGTPLSQGVVDLYAQMRFLSPKILGYRSFYSFAANHLEFHKEKKGFIVAAHNLGYLAAKIQPYTYQVTKAECLALPDKLYDEHWLRLTPEQGEAYQRAKEEILLEATAEEMESGIAIFRVFTALQQIVCGFWRRTDPRTGEQALLEFPNRRLDALEAAVRSPGEEKTIVWSKYRYNLRRIVERLAQVYGPDSVAQFHGGLSERERNAEVERFRGAARFFVATQSAAGHGLTLNEAKRVVFFSNEFKYATRIQAEDRNHRLGQAEPVTYIDLACERSIDGRILTALAKKANAVEEFKRRVDAVKEGRRDALRKMVEEL